MHKNKYAIYATKHDGARVYVTYLHESDRGDLLDENFDKIDDIDNIVTDLVRLVSPFPTVYSEIVIQSDDQIIARYTVN